MPAAASMFDPAQYASVRRPFDVAHTLPAWCYTSPEFFAREIERIFRRTWNCIGHESRVARPGDYLAFEFAGVPLIVARGKDGRVRSFVNHCRHRSSRIVEGEGNCSFFKCPYHNWAYALSGELVATPMVEETAEFRRADHALLPVRTEIWSGLLWINLDPDAPALADYLGDLPPRCAPYRADEMVCVWRKEFTVEANWKLYYENFSEGYHVPFVHKGNLANQRVPGRKLDPAVETRGDYVAHFTRHEGTRGVFAGDAHFPAIPGLPPECLGGTFYPAVNPNAMLGYTIDAAWVVALSPRAADRTMLDLSLMMPEATTRRDDFAAVLPNYIKRYEVTIPEDIRAAENQQKGISSPITAPGRFMPMERLVHAIDLWVLDRVIGNEA